MTKFLGWYFSTRSVMSPISSNEPSSRTAWTMRSHEARVVIMPEIDSITSESFGRRRRELQVSEES